MQYAELIADVRKRCGITDDGRADRAVAAVVSVLGGALSGADADGLSERLPSPFAERLRRSAGGAELKDVHELYERVAMRAAIVLGLAVEETQIVLQLLAELASEEATARARRHLPPDIAALLTPRRAFAEPPPRQRLPAPAAPPHVTLASGRPGSFHPLSESRADRAQEHSVARSSNPHAQSKLSSARR